MKNANNKLQSNPAEQFVTKKSNVNDNLILSNKTQLASGNRTDQFFRTFSTFDDVPFEIALESFSFLSINAIVTKKWGCNFLLTAALKHLEMFEKVKVDLDARDIKD